MAIVTELIAPSKGVAGSLQLSKANLISESTGGLSADGYFNDSANWKAVHLYYGSATGNQKITVSFDGTSGALPAADFFASSTALGTHNIDYILIEDFDGGSFRVERADLTPAEFDVVLTQQPDGFSYTYATAAIPFNVTSGTPTINLYGETVTYTIIQVTETNYGIMSLPWSNGFINSTTGVVEYFGQELQTVDVIVEATTAGGSVQATATLEQLPF